MASTSLSAKTSENIIRAFTFNLSVRQAAADCGVTPKSVQKYYTLLFDRLYEIGYYMSVDTIGNMSWYGPGVSDMDRLGYYQMDWRQKLRLRYKNSDLDERYCGKFFTQRLYMDMLMHLFAHEDDITSFSNTMFKDTLNLIKLTGPLNRACKNKDAARIKHNEQFGRRMPRVLKKDFVNYLDFYKRCDSQGLCPPILEGLEPNGLDFLLFEERRGEQIHFLGFQRPFKPRSYKSKMCNGGSPMLVRPPKYNNAGNLVEVEKFYDAIIVCAKTDNIAFVTFDGKHYARYDRIWDQRFDPSHDALITGCGIGLGGF